MQSARPPEQKLCISILSSQREPGYDSWVKTGLETSGDDQAKPGAEQAT